MIIIVVNDYICYMDFKRLPRKLKKRIKLLLIRDFKGRKWDESAKDSYTQYLYDNYYTESDKGHDKEFIKQDQWDAMVNQWESFAHNIIVIDASHIKQVCKPLSTLSIY